MEIRRALTMFRLQKRVPIEELNSIFRELVKKYHPDKMREHPEWAHERMAEINDAYETLAVWISKPPPRDKVVPVYEPESQEEDVYRNEIRPLPAKTEKLFIPVFNLFLDGLGIYYQYGLEKPVYRGEGVRRFRYREAFRTVKKARDDFEKLTAEMPHPIVTAVSRFARLTAAEMEVGEPVFEDMMTYRRFDDRLRIARRSFDDAVKEIFFPELIPAHLKGRAVSGLYACYSAFVIFMLTFTKGDRRNIGILMTARYDALMDLIEFRNNGILRF